MVRVACMRYDHALHVPPARRQIMIEVVPEERIRRLDDLRRRRALLRRAQLDHERLAPCTHQRSQTNAKTRSERNLDSPMLFALPGRTWAVVTPPAIASAYESSCVLSPSMLRSQGRMGALREFVSDAPKDEINVKLISAGMSKFVARTA